MKKILTGIALLSVVLLVGCNQKKKSSSVAEAESTQAVEFIRLNVPLVLDASQAEAATQLGQKLVAASQEDEGMIEYDMYRSETRPGWFLIYETWKDQPSLDTHSAAPHFTTIVPQLQGLGEMTIEQFQQVAEPEKDGKSIRINCRIVAKDEASKEQIIAKATELVAASLQDEGVVEYDILSSVTRPNELMIYETWKDQPSLDAHSASAHFTRLVPEIQGLAERMSIEQFYK